MVKPMDTERGKRIRRMRVAKGLTQDELARALGVSRGAIGNWELGGGVAEKHVSELEGILGGTIAAPVDRLPLGNVSSFTGEQQAITPLVPPIGIPIVATVEAGVFRRVDMVYDTGDERSIAASRDPRFPHVRHMAFRVAGDSMNLRGIQPGDVIVAVDWAGSGVELKEGQIVVVERLRFAGQEKEITVKEVRLRKDGIDLVPRSTNPAHEPLFVPWANLDDGTEISIVALVVSRQQIYQV